MITFAGQTHKFNFRVVGIALHNDQVLLHRAEHEDFWTLPGGRVELGEPTVETLMREMREELRLEVRVERLVWVVENFFTYLDQDWHEIAFYFLMTLPEDSVLLTRSEPFFGIEEFYSTPESMKLIFEWRPLHELDDLYLLPSFLKSGLRSLPEHTVHVVHRDE